MKTQNSCLRCGMCCRSFPITHDVALNIMRYLDKHPNIIRELDTSKPPHGECIFLKHTSPTTTSCIIYDSGTRPIICDIMATKGYAELRCPHGFKSQKYSAQKADDLLINELRKSPTIGDLNAVFTTWVKAYLYKSV